MYTGKITTFDSKNKAMLNALRPYMMPIAMLTGALFYPFFAKIAGITTYLIFLMLLFTFCDISFNKIRFTWLHIWLALIQIGGGSLLYFLLAPINVILAQAMLVCIIAPTATSAPVITRMLKGNVESLMAFSILSNLAVAFTAPLLFSLIGENQSLSFVDSLFSIGEKFAFLLLLPFLLAWFVQKFFPKVREGKKILSNACFFLWVAALTILTGKIVLFVTEQASENYIIEIIIAFSAMFVCFGQFIIGRKIGRKYNDTVAGGQGLGQKNTILSIWMAQSFLNPIASIGGAAYVFWQNLVNSTQVWKNRKNLN